MQKPVPDEPKPVVAESAESLMKESGIGEAEGTGSRSLAGQERVVDQTQGAPVLSAVAKAAAALSSGGGGSANLAPPPGYSEAPAPKISGGLARPASRVSTPEKLASAPAAGSNPPASPRPAAPAPGPTRATGTGPTTGMAREPARSAAAPETPRRSAAIEKPTPVGPGADNGDPLAPRPTASAAVSLTVSPTVSPAGKPEATVAGRRSRSLRSSSSGSLVEGLSIEDPLAGDPLGALSPQGSGGSGRDLTGGDLGGSASGFRTQVVSPKTSRSESLQRAHVERSPLG